MAFIREKTVKGRPYYYLVKSVREGGSVRQKIISYIGSQKPPEEEVRRLVRKAR